MRRHKEMRYAFIYKRRMKLLSEIAKVSDYEVCAKHMGGYNDVSVLKNSKWIAGNYSFSPVSDKAKCILREDLRDLARLGFIYFSPQYNRTDCGGICYGEDVNQWTIGLNREGLNASEEHNKHWLRKAYEKEPVTAIQIFVTVVLTIVMFFLGFVIGQKQSDVNVVSQPSALIAPSSQPTIAPSTQPVIDEEDTAFYSDQ